MSGTILGLELNSVRDRRAWHLVMSPGVSIQGTEEVWDLGDSLTESAGNFATGYYDRGLRHPRDNYFPVRAMHDIFSGVTVATTLRLVSSVTVATSAVLTSDGTYAVVYLADREPYNFTTFTSTTGLTLTPTGSSYNKFKFDNSLAGSTVSINYALSQAICHNGLTALTVCGPVYNLQLEYRSDIPMGGVDLCSISQWTNTGLLITASTIGQGVTLSNITAEATSSLYTVQEFVDYKSRMISLDFELFYGSVKIEALGSQQEWDDVYYTDDLRRHTPVLYSSGTLLTVAVTLSSGASLQWRGAYVVDGVDRWAYDIGVVAGHGYVSSYPLATTAVSISVDVFSPYQMFNCLSIDGLRTSQTVYGKINIVGLVSGVTVPYAGPVAATTTLLGYGAQSYPVQQGTLPGEYWTYFGCNVDTDTVATIAVLAGGTLTTVQWLYTRGTAYNYNVWLDVSCEDEYSVTRVKPRIADKWYMNSDYGTLCTITVVGGVIFGTNTTMTSATVGTEILIDGGSYVYATTTIGGNLYQSPNVYLPIEASYIDLDWLPTNTDIPR